MKVIDDKEVGKMWEFWSELEVPDSVMASTEICKLIRKFVAERAMRTMLGWKGTDWAEGFDAATNIALGDFGIDLADWKDDD